MDAHRPGKDFGCGHRAGRRVRTLSRPFGDVAGDKLYLAFSDKTGCARVATGPAARPGGAFKASPCLVDDASDVSLFVDEDGTGYLIWGGGSIAKQIGRASCRERVCP